VERLQSRQLRSLFTHSAAAGCENAQQIAPRQGQINGGGWQLPLRIGVWVKKKGPAERRIAASKPLGGMGLAGRRQAYIDPVAEDAIIADNPISTFHKSLAARTLAQSVPFHPKRIGIFKRFDRQIRSTRSVDAHGIQPGSANSGTGAAGDRFVIDEVGPSLRVRPGKNDKVVRAAVRHGAADYRLREGGHD
jgi:hypothetical protein